jgi:uncharacterized DUF497 family protein
MRPILPSSEAAEACGAFLYIEMAHRRNWALFRIYDMLVVLEFDESKSLRNVRERSIGFERFADMEPETAVTTPDTRRDYGEVRLRVLGQIDGRLHAAVITLREDRIRVISLRRANEREERWYEKVRQPAR